MLVPASGTRPFLHWQRYTHTHTHTHIYIYKDCYDLVWCFEFDDLQLVIIIRRGDR
jgi:hypothetical protein